MEQALIDYIKQAQAQGTSEENIFAALRESGWQEEDIKEALKSTEPKQASTKKKSSLPLIVGAIALAFLLIGGGVSAALYTQTWNPGWNPFGAQSGQEQPTVFLSLNVEYRDECIGVPCWKELIMDKDGFWDLTRVEGASQSGKLDSITHIQDWISNIVFANMKGLSMNEEEIEILHQETARKYGKKYEELSKKYEKKYEELASDYDIEGELTDRDSYLLQDGYDEYSEAIEPLFQQEDDEFEALVQQEEYEFAALPIIQPNKEFCFDDASADVFISYTVNTSGQEFTFGGCVYWGNYNIVFHELFKQIFGDLEEVFGEPLYVEPGFTGGYQLDIDATKKLDSGYKLITEYRCNLEISTYSYDMRIYQSPTFGSLTGFLIDQYDREEIVLINGRKGRYRETLIFGGDTVVGVWIIWSTDNLHLMIHSRGRYPVDYKPDPLYENVECQVLTKDVLIKIAESMQ